MDNANLPTSTIEEPLRMRLTRWSPWLRLDSEAWEPDLVGVRYLPELDEIAAEAKEIWDQHATPAEMGEIFKRLSLACRGQPGESTDRKATMALMLRYLVEYPASVLAAAVDTWIKTQVFMPAISELRTICDAELMKLTRTWRRAQGLAGHCRSTHEKRKNEQAEAERIKEENARMTPERWAEIQASARRVPVWEPPLDPIVERVKSDLVAGRDRMRDQLTALARQQRP